MTTRVYKCLPGDPCFPSRGEWDRLSRTLSQPVIYDQRPLAAVCYKNSSEYSPAGCEQVSDNQFNGTFLAASSNALQLTIFEDVVTPHGIEQCPFNPGPDAICHQGRVPSFSINATTIEDIQATIAFASKYNLHLVVKNTGHEYIGREFGVGSVEIFTRYIQGINFTDNFVPSGNSGHDVEGQHAVTIGAGVQWGELYLAAQQHDRTVVGAFPPSVTVGAGAGWVLGTGHSPLARFYGLGVDNVLQLSVVLPNASHVITNKYQNSDLFWALRGGGGPSFGVVTSMTYRTHPNLPYTASSYVASADSPESFRKLLQVWLEYHNLVMDAGWSGSWPYADNTLQLALLAQGIPPTRPLAIQILEAFYAASKAIPGVNVSAATTVSYSSFYEWYNASVVSSVNTVEVGIPTAISSWLVPPEVFELSTDELADALALLPTALPYVVGGGVVSTIDPDSAAVTPAWRRMITHVIARAPFNQTSDPKVVEAYRQAAHNYTEPLQRLAPIPYGGQYINEADILETNWQGAYWGAHYPRLLSIKKEIDPQDLLIVYKGVNSEEWDDEIICKRL
ncbi:FAD-binding domain-containing protein [Wolfiporia cocos MD-104 SS10]|uniref:FAD-binding domain-containing protein n=1 Tax=Wolfiporia cocos (strain MD-104) TaxID=742152 RepID=A0A2H3JJW6_WOLCO|nr:FAD-binding domain-containing protein [Wolfiporia cocos MD-104 SS10]